MAKRRRSRRSRSLGAYVGLGVAVFWAFFPVYFLVSSAFMDPRMMFSWPPQLVFRPTLVNFVNLWERWPGFFTTLQNSLIITIGSVLLALMISVPAAYAFSRFRSRLLSLSAFWTIVVRMFPPIIITIPLYPALFVTGLYDKHITLILLYVTFFVSLMTWILKAAIDALPVETEEAAMLDGCGRARIMVQIVLPLVGPGVMASSVFLVNFAWNEFLFAHLFAGSASRTAPVVISEMMGGVTGAQWGSTFAASTLQLIPVLVFVWLFQKALLKGLNL